MGVAAADFADLQRRFANGNVRSTYAQCVEETD